jgi:hypothetical protein
MQVLGPEQAFGQRQQTMSHKRSRLDAFGQVAAGSRDTYELALEPANHVRFMTHSLWR